MAPDGEKSPTDAEMGSARDHQEHRVPRGLYTFTPATIQARSPAVILLHGFPDDLHLYDRLVPELASQPRPRCQPGVRNRLLTALLTRAADRTKPRFAGVSTTRIRSDRPR